MEKEITTEDVLWALDNTDEPILDGIVDIASDAVSFSQVLWDLFREQGLHADEGLPNFAKMENLVDAINGELIAAVLFLSSIDIDVSEVLDKHADDIKNHEHGDLVPGTVVEGYRRLGKRIKATKAAMKAEELKAQMSEHLEP